VKGFFQFKIVYQKNAEIARTFQSWKD